MNSEYSPASSKTGPFIPLLLLTVSILFIFIWQLVNISQQRSAFQEAQRKTEEFVTTNTPKQEELVKQSKELQTKLEKLVTDLLELAKTDPDAKAITDKYKI